jgi:hypothetical protein
LAHTRHDGLPRLLVKMMLFVRVFLTICATDVACGRLVHTGDMIPRAVPVPVVHFGSAGALGAVSVRQ